MDLSLINWESLENYNELVEDKPSTKVVFLNHKHLAEIPSDRGFSAIFVGTYLSKGKGEYANLITQNHAFVSEDTKYVINGCFSLDSKLSNAESGHRIAIKFKEKKQKIDFFTVVSLGSWLTKMNASEKSLFDSSYRHLLSIKDAQIILKPEYEKIMNRRIMASKVQQGIDYDEKTDKFFFVSKSFKSLLEDNSK